jgi:hypothetical protein
MCERVADRFDGKARTWSSLRSTWSAVMRRITVAAFGAVTLAIVSLVLPPEAGANVTITTATLAGNDIPGVGRVTIVRQIDINNHGDWIAVAVTDNPDLSANIVLLHNGQVMFRQGQVLTAPAGAVLDDFISVALSNTGSVAAVFRIRGTGQQGLYVNNQLILATGSMSSSIGGPYMTLRGVKINSHDALLLEANVDDPTVPGTHNAALIRIDASLMEAVVAKEGDTLLANTPRVVESFGGLPQVNTAFNDAGDAMFAVIFRFDGGTNDEQAIFLNGTLLAQQGFPSPDPARNYNTSAGPFNQKGLGLNNVGDFAFQAELTGTRDVLIRNGQIVVDEQVTVLPGTAPNPISSLSTLEPVHVDDRGRVVWTGFWAKTFPHTSGLFRDNELLVEDNATPTSDGFIIQLLSHDQSAYETSDNGEWIMFKATVTQSGRPGAFIIHIPEIDPDADTDGDGLTDAAEAGLGTDPLNADTDADGLSDGDEVNVHGTNPLDQDSDDDGLQDGTEIERAMGSGCPAPLTADSDGDGLLDGAEAAAGTNPCAADTDGDGVRDDVDPAPLDPGASPEQLEQMALDIASDTLTLDLAFFSGPTQNINRLRRGAMAVAAFAARMAIAGGEYALAIRLLEGYRDRVDGKPSPPDWMIDSPEQSDLADRVGLLIQLLAAG